jgi:hypothetical protein
MVGEQRVRKLILTMVALVLLWEGHPAFGGGRFFVGSWDYPFVYPRSSRFLSSPRSHDAFLFPIRTPAVCHFAVGSGSLAVLLPARDRLVSSFSSRNSTARF